MGPRLSANAAQGAATAAERASRGRGLKAVGKGEEQPRPDRGHHPLPPARARVRRTAAGDDIDTAILEREAYDKESNVGLELAKGADGSAADAVRLRREALHTYITDHGPVSTGDLYIVFPEISEKQMGAAIKRLRGAGRHRGQGDHQGHRTLHGPHLYEGRARHEGQIR